MEEERKPEPYDDRWRDGIEIELPDGSIRRYEETYFLSCDFDFSNGVGTPDCETWTMRHTKYDWRRSPLGEITINATTNLYPHPTGEKCGPADTCADLFEEPIETSKRQIAPFKSSRLARLETYTRSEVAARVFDRLAFTQDNQIRMSFRLERCAAIATAAASLAGGGPGRRPTISN